MKRLVAVCGLALVAGCHSNQAAPAIPQATFISPTGANHSGAQFSPDGKRIFWWTPAAGRSQLWSAKADLSDSSALLVTSSVPLIWSPDGSQIALAVSGSAGSLENVAVMPSAGGAARVLVGGSNLSVPVGWNPDGDRLAYATIVGSQGGTTFQGMVTSLSHGGASPLIPGESRPYAGMWSPDGSHIEFQVFEQGRGTIWIADSDGSKPKQLTSEGFENFGGFGSTSPFSPNGKELAYVSKRTGTTDVWVVGIDGSPPRQLTRDIRNDYHPIWSPDGRWIAFLSDRGRQTDIWVVPSAGGIEQRVTNDPAGEDLIGWVAGTDRLAFLTGVGASSIWSMSLADGKERQLTPDSIRTSCCDISPDGTQLLFSISHGGGNDQLAVMPVAGGAWRVVGEGSAFQAYMWSPDGSQIAFVSDQSGTAELWVAPAAGGTARQLTDWPEGIGNPLWNADGSMLYFVSNHESRLGDVWRVPLAGGVPVRVTTEAAISGIMNRRGRSELFATTIVASGTFNTVRVAPDGSISTVWNKGNSGPQTLLPRGDSLLIFESQAGGAFGVRLIPVDGHGDGQTLLKPGESSGDLSPDGKALLYSIPVGANNNLALLDRTTGATRVLSTTPDTKGAATFTPDGKTVIFVRSHDVHRIAIADLTKLLATSTVKPH